ncbi:hypothetical protein K2173_024860 [Erythroxylum novogranatense]|uniref:Reverse transcriptase Ty1/copia-type domain-containing protein n=1 Tax=Erythroxylum novogranatense TaxID=1862640 RepID=A0AAV8UCC8_9ROSI|nr:hypothetical protein K2173_024860 [Erythroxylum novogranatense]
MNTRAQNNIFKPKIYTTSKYPLPRTEEPCTIAEALRLPQWRASATDEFNALVRNNTWDIVPASEAQNVVGCKWLFRIKQKSDGSIDKYKSRLVAKGFSQAPGIDYKETFSPVVKHSTIKVVLTIALANRWSLHQMDVNNAFLQGHLLETVYMKQPPGFTHPDFPTHVCKL